MRSSLAWLGPGRVIEDPLVVIEGSAISFAGPAMGSDVGIPDPDEVIDVDGFAMPGVVDRHVHIGLSDPGAVLAGGVTAVRDLGWPADDIFSLAAASETEAFNGPLVRAVGPMITCRGGYPTRAGWGPPGTGLEVSGAEEAAGTTRDLLGRSGVPVAKVALNSDAGPTLSDQELLAVCDTAHGAGARVTAHAQGKGQVERALGAGVDELAHCPWSERLADRLIEGLAGRVRIVSTLDILSYGKNTPELRIATENLSRFLAAGGTVVYGTDLGNGPIPAGIHVGEAWHMLRAGLSPHDVLEALAFRPLGPGEPADLIVLAEDPLQDLNALAEPIVVIRGGRVRAR